jgi:hypothetical protein
MPIIGRENDTPYGPGNKGCPIRFGQIVIGHIAVVEGMTKEDFDFFWKRLLSQRAEIESVLVPRPLPNPRD